MRALEAILRNSRVARPRSNRSPRGARSCELVELVRRDGVDVNLDRAVVRFVLDGHQ